MKLYLLRHGHSPSTLEARVATDFERPLSETGRAAVRRMAAELISRDGRPQAILYSPLKRAVQTALEAGAVLNPPAGSKMFDALANAMTADGLYQELQGEIARVSELLLVGHQPQLGELAAYLSGKIFELRPGGMIALELNHDAPALPLWSCNPVS